MNVGTLTIFLGVTTSGINKAIRDVSRMERSVASSVSAINLHMLNLSRTLMTFATFPTVVLGGAATNAFSKFEYNLSKITGMIGIAEDQTKKWGQEILQLAPKLGANPIQMSDAAFYVASSNPQRDPKINTEILEASTKAAEAGLGNIKDVVDIVTSAMNAYGAANLDAAYAVDAVIFGVKEGKAEIDSYASSMGKLLPAAQKVGMRFNEVAAATAALSRTGTNAAEGVTQIRRLLFTLVQQPEQGKVALNELDNSYNNLINTLRSEGLMSMLLEIKNMSEFRGEDFLSKVFPNIRALLPVIDFLGENLEETIGIFERSEEIGGELNKMWGNYAKTMRYMIRQVFSTANVSMIEFGNQIKGVVIPILGQIIKAISDVIKWFVNLDDRVKSIIVSITLFLAAFGPAYFILSSMASVVLTLIKTALIPFRLIWKILSGLFLIVTGRLNLMKKAMIGLNASFLASPVFWVAAAIAVAAYGIWKIVQNAELFGQAFTRIFKTIHMWMLEFKVWLFNHLEKPLLNTLKVINSFLPSSFQINVDWDLKDEIEEASKEIAKLKAELSDPNLANFNQAFTAMGDTAINDFKWIGEQLEKGWDWIVEKAKNQFDRLGAKHNMPGAGESFGPTKPPNIETFEQTMDRLLAKDAQVRAALQNDYIYDEFAEVDKIIQEAQIELALFSKRGIEAGDNVRVIQQRIGVLKEIIDELNKREILSSGQLKDLKNFKIELNMDLMHDSINTMNTDMRMLNEQAKYLTGMWDENGIRLSLLQTNLRGLLSVDIQGWTEDNKKHWANMVENMLKDIQKLQMIEQINQKLADSASEFMITTAKALGGVEGAYEQLGQIIKGVLEDIIQMLLREMIMNALSNKTRQGSITLRSAETALIARDNLKKMEAVRTNIILAGTDELRTSKTEDNTRSILFNWMASRTARREIEKATQAKLAEAAASHLNAGASAVEASAKSGEAVSSATASGAKMPFPLNIIAIGLGVAAVLGALASMSKARNAAKMARGGIVPTGFPNDTYPALLTSGETVLPKPKSLSTLDRAQSASPLQRLEKMPIKNKTFERQPITVQLPEGEWMIRGRDIYYIVKEEERRNKNTY